MTIRSRNSRGFSLVELLIVMVMMGIVILAISTLYKGTQQSAYSQDEVVELQQNLRIAMDHIARDVRMAGFMIPSTSTPISTANQNNITFQTASIFGAAARVVDDDPATPPNLIPNTVDTNTAVDFGVASGEQADLFKINNKVRIIRPPNQNDLFPTRTLTVSGVSPSATPPIIEIKGFDAGDNTIQIRSGDIIVRITNGSNNPNTVQYLREGDLLKRRTDEGVVGVADTREVAEGLRQSANTNLDGLQFRYLRDDGTETTTVASDLDKIRAVRVTLTGTVTTLEGDKTRSLTSVITLRNR